MSVGPAGLDPLKGIVCTWCTSKGLLLEKSNEAGRQPGEAIIHLWSASALGGADIHHLTYTAEHWAGGIQITA